MFKNFFKKQKKRKISQTNNETFPRYTIMLKENELVVYFEERLLLLHKSYSDVSDVIKNNRNESLREAAMEAAKRMLKVRITETDRPELMYLLSDQSRMVLIKALDYLDKEVLDALDKYKKTGELAHKKIWS